MPQASTQNGDGGVRGARDEPESLYERFPWLYAFCRDHLFRDDTEKIATSLWPAGGHVEGDSLLELGCGPGFYARRLAARYEHLQVTGIDRSGRQLLRARGVPPSAQLQLRGG
jgi:arsenite methyltransferase